jgi:hypothetical protein
MIPIPNFFDSEVDVYRLYADTDESPSDTEDFILIEENVVCSFQALSDSYYQDSTGASTKDYTMFTQEPNIVEGDKIVAEDLKFIVKGIKSYDLRNYTLREISISSIQ